MRTRVAALAVVAAALLLAPAAPAQSKRERELPKDAELSKKESSKIPERDLAGDISRKKKEKVRERPALEYDQYRLGVEVQVASKRREQIETLQKIIDLGASRQEAPDLNFRLAELYWEESKYFFMEANRRDDDILRARSEKNEARARQAEGEKKELFKRSEYFQSLAVERYATIVKKYPKYERMDEVLFFLGHNMWDAGKESDAVKVYMKLLKGFTKSKYLPDAWVAVGQYYFNNSKGKHQDLKIALESFKKAASFTDSKVYGYALYMQGWCYFNMGEFRSAMDLYKTVIYYGELQGDSRSGALSKEARKDYVVSFSRIGDVMAAKADFQKVGGDANYFGMLKGLANLYFEDGKDREATLVYYQLIKDRPLNPEAPFFQGRIVDCVMRVGDKAKTVKQVRELVRITKEVEKAGVVQKDEDKRAFEDAKELAERTLSNLAVNWHKEAQKTRDENTFFLAAEVYQDYLEIFGTGDSAKAYDLRFFYAELLNDNLGKYDRAAEEYTKVLLEDIKRVDPPKGPDGKPLAAPEKPGRFLVDAAYNAILAFDEVAKKFEKDEPAPKTGDGKTRLAVPAPKMNLLAACERYIKYVPRGDKQVEVMFKAANIYYRYNYFDKAVELFAKIALEHPEAELAEYSANLIIDSCNLQGDWAGMNTWARKFYAVPKLAKGKLKEDLAKYIEQSSFKLVNILEEKGDYVGAAEAYLTFVREWPKSDLADLALFNASVDFFKGKRVDRSNETRSELVKRYPRSRYLPQCIYANGESYEATGYFEKAADAYEGYARAWAAQKEKKAQKKDARRGDDKKEEAPLVFEEPKAQVALFNAGVFREGLGQYREALKDRTLYVELWPNGKDTEAVFLSIADLHRKTNQLGKALKHLEEYEKKYMRDPDKLLAAEEKIAKVYEKMGSKPNLGRIYGRVADYHRKLGRAQRARLGPEALEAVAQAYYLAVEPEFAEYARLGLPKDEKKLKGALEVKQKALVEVQKRYTEVINFKVADPAICSLYKIGLLYKDFADALLNAPVPEMPWPKQLNPLKPVWGKPWSRWPQEYKDAVPEADFESLKATLADAKVQFEQAYRDQLQQIALPGEEKAAEAFATAVEKARELAVYNECSKKALALLADKYKPHLYPKVTELMTELKAAGASHEGNGLLAAVQPIPAPVAGAQAAAPAAPPVLSRPAPKGRERAAEPPAAGPAEAPRERPRADEPPERPSERRAAPASSAPPPELEEPEDPDLLQ